MCVGVCVYKVLRVCEMCMCEGVCVSSLRLIAYNMHARVCVCACVGECHEYTVL